MRSRFLAAMTGSLQVLATMAYPQTATDDYDAETMRALCLGEVADLERNSQRLVCSFRLQGVAEVLILNCSSKRQGFAPADFLTASAPPSIGALRQTFLNFMDDHPEYWGEQWFVVASRAMSSTFPCAGSNGNN